MEALSSSASSSTFLLPPANRSSSRKENPLQRRQRHVFALPSVSPGSNRLAALCSSFVFPPSINGVARKGWRDFPPPSSVGGGKGEEEEANGAEEKGGRLDDEDVERALEMDGSIPGTSEEFVRRVSSRAYDMRRNLKQIIDSISYDVETNPWREDSKPVYVLTQRENQLWTMKTRRSRSEVEKELGLLFSKGGKWGSETENKAKHSRMATKFHMLVEDIREGVLVFEDEHDATRYCDLLQGGGQGCEGIAEIDASSVFDICRKMRALAVLFRRGRTPPLPESLELDLKARKRSLEDQQDSV